MNRIGNIYLALDNYYEIKQTNKTFNMIFHIDL